MRCMAGLSIDGHILYYYYGGPMTQLSTPLQEVLRVSQLSGVLPYVHAV